MLLLFIMVYLQLELQSQSLYKEAKDTALTYKGIHETSYNYSSIIARFNGNTKRSWCMDFVYYCFKSASKASGKKNKLLKTSSCSYQLKYANCIGSGLKVITFKNFGKINVNTGIGIFKHGNININDIGKFWQGHTGILLRKIDNNTFEFIEGNTNSKGSREGGLNSLDGVYIKKRNVFNTNLPLLAIIQD